MPKLRPNFIRWVAERHQNAAAFRPPRPESSFKGPVNAMLNEFFPARKNWLIIAEITLRDVIADRNRKPILNEPEPDKIAESGEEEAAVDEEPETDEEDKYEAAITEDSELDVGNISVDSQGGIVQGSRIDALHPDFGVSYGRPELFTDRTHLYVEVKNGEKPLRTHTQQIIDYIEAIANSIPDDFKQDVVLMLVDAGQTYVWRITPTTEIQADSLWSPQNVRVGKTYGRMMGNILRELSARV